MMDENPSSIEIPMNVAYQSYREVAQAAVAEIRRQGYTMSDEQARDLESRLEREILRAWTAHKASKALNTQIRVSWRAIRDILEEIPGLTLEGRTNAAGN
jgi:hypothetical protein